MFDGDKKINIAYFLAILVIIVKKFINYKQTDFLLYPKVQEHWKFRIWIDYFRHCF